MPDNLKLTIKQISSINKVTIMQKLVKIKQFQMWQPVRVTWIIYQFSSRFHKLLENILKVVLFIVIAIYRKKSEFQPYVY